MSYHTGSFVMVLTKYRRRQKTHGIVIKQVDEFHYAVRYENGKLSTVSKDRLHKIDYFRHTSGVVLVRE